MGLTARQMRAVIVLLAGALIVVLNQTLLSPALPVIMSDMDVDAPTVQWLTSGYSLVEAIIIPLSAFLMGRFGSRKLYIGGLVIFLAGTLLAAFAPIFFVLLLGRMVQASATGFVMPLVFTSILLIFPREKRGSAMGIVSLVIGFAPAVGPSVAGVLVETVGWRALFVIVAVLTAIVAVCAIFMLPDKSDFERSTFDKPSVALSSFGLLALLYGLSSISSSDNIAVNIVCIVVGAILMFFFVRRQSRLEVPFLRVEVLKTRDYRVNVIVVACFQAALVGTGVLLPIYLQNLLGISPLQTGLVMLPGAILGALAAMISGRLFDKMGARKLVIPGALVCLLGGVGLMFFSLESSIAYITLIYTAIALGMQFTMTPINTWGVNALDNSVIQHAGATSNTINQVAASLGTAVLVSLSATSAFLFPDATPIVQQMDGIRIALCFTAVMMVVTFVLSAAMVRDRKAEPSVEASYTMESFPEQPHPMVSVGAVMNDKPYYVHQSGTVREVAELLSAHKTSGVPVVDDAHHVIAYVSDGDIMSYIGRSDASVFDSTMMVYRMYDDAGIAKRVHDLFAMNVLQIATKHVVSVSPETPLEDACRLFVEKRLKKVPVVHEGKLVGTISRPDIMSSTIGNLAEIERRALMEAAH